MIRPTADNVLVVLEPEVTETKSGLYTGPVTKKSRYSRIARVLAVGPGYYGRTSWLHPEGIFHAMELKPGDRVTVDALCGQDYKLDISVPRHNKGSEFQSLCGERGEFRIIREDEALAVVEED